LTSVRLPNISPDDWPGKMAQQESQAAAPPRIAECPVWSVSDQTLYWLDITGQALGCLQPEAQRHRRFKLASPIAAIAPRARGGLIAAGIDGFSVIDLRSGELSHYADAPWTATELPNDGKCDPQGRLWVGTKDTLGGLECGGLYCLDANASCRRMAVGFGNANGIGWSPDSTQMYATDTRRSEIYAYAFSGYDGRISQRRILTRVASENGRPDGLTVDAKGYVWSANWRGGSIMRYAPDGSLASLIRIGAPCPTTCTFGGARFGVLYVTTARIGENTLSTETDDPILSLPGLGIGNPASSFLG
jgi:sugar lactone lactonase YvrE